MLVITVVILTSAFAIFFYREKKKPPTLQAILLVILSVIAAIQNIKFFYLIFVPSFKGLPLLGGWLSSGLGVVQIPKNFESCLESVGSEFDRFNLALGPVAVIWLSIKQTLELMPNKTRKPNKKTTNP